MRLGIPANKQHLALGFIHAKALWKTKLYLGWIKEAREIMLLGVFHRFCNAHAALKDVNTVLICH